MSDLLPCPFCGSPADTDSNQSFRAITTGHIESSAAIYCTGCNVQMQHCYSDHPGTNRDDLMADLIENWNRRAAPPPPAEQASGELPEPKYIYHPSDVEGEDDLFEFAVAGAVDEGCDTCERLYTADQVRAILAAALSQRPVVDEDSTELRKVAKRNLRSLIDRLGDDADKRTMLLCLEELS